MTDWAVEEAMEKCLEAFEKRRRDPKIREALIKAYQAMDKWAAKYRDGLHPPGD